MPEAAGLLVMTMSGRASSPVLIGRAEQLTALEGAFESVRQGGPATVLLGGEAGVGKSRLVSEFSTTARLAGARVLTGDCLQLGTDGLPFGPFTAMLRDLVHDMGAAAFTAMLPGRATRELARLLPELGIADPDDEPGAARAALFEGMLSTLEQLGGRSPVVLVIEDAHWADRSSRDLLTFLIGNQRAIAGLMVVVTFRSDELHRTHPLRPLLAAMDRIAWVSRVDLPRLSWRGTADLAAGFLGRPVTDDVAEALFRRTEGNPLFIESLLCCDGDLSTRLPESLRDLLLGSVHRLPEETQDVLRAASAGDGVVGHGLLAAVTGLGDTSLTQALRPAVAANVLRAGGAGYVFRHELIREAVHEDLLPGEHGRLHNRFAAAIDADPALVPPGRAAIEKAHHWYAGHDATSALIAAWQAAGDSVGAVAAAERLGLLTRVLELWDQVPDVAALTGADHLRVLEDAVAAALDADESERGIALATSALKEVDKDTEPVRAALLLEMRGQFRLHSSRQGHMADFDEALRLVPASPSPSPAATAARTKILLVAARCIPMERNLRHYAEEALQLARQSGDTAAEAKAMLNLAMFDADEGEQAAPGSAPLELIGTARALAIQARAHRTVHVAAINESHLLEGAGFHELAFQSARDGIACTDVQRLSRSDGSILSINQAEPLFALGRWDETIAVADDALEVYLTRVPAYRALLQFLKGMVAIARGDVPAAARAAAAAADLRLVTALKYHDNVTLGRLRILLGLAGGPAAGLAATAAELETHDLGMVSPRYAWPVLTTGCLAGIAAAREESLRTQATEVADRLRTAASKLEVSGPAQQAQRVTFDAADGLLGWLLGAPAAPPADLQAKWDGAAAAWEAVSEPYPTAQALLYAGELALAGGDRDGAAARLRRGKELADELGAVPLSTEIETLARRGRVWLGSGIGSNSAPGAGLTERELEVLRLVATGRSNREIAAELFIAPKTASVHVSNILGKLDVSSRTEAATLAYTLHLLE
jgi:DNA-binding CsgD family transcriptional regulator/PAS domain-containing protein